MTALPSNISYGTVVGRFGSPQTRSDDIDGYPDFIAALDLTVTFTASVASVVVATASPSPVTLEMVPVVCTVDADGYLTGPDGRPGVHLIATNDSDLNPSGWTWAVSFLKSGAQRNAFKPFNMSMPANTIIDVALVIPVGSTTGSTLGPAQVAAELALTRALQASASATQAEAAAALTRFVSTNAAVDFLREQMQPINRPVYQNAIRLDRMYPSPYTGAVRGSFDQVAATWTTTPGTTISIGDPGDLLPTFRGTVFGGISNPNPTTFRVQAGKITDAFYPFAAKATPDAGGFFAIDLSGVETWRKGEWSFRLETAANPGVQVGGLWPLGDVYSGATVELRAISDDDYFVASTPAPVSGNVTFLSSTPGVKRMLLRDNASGKVYADTAPTTGNIRSFVVGAGQPGYGTRFPEQSYVYDQAVALCAAVAKGERDLAAQLMRGIARLQTRTGPQAGGFRFSGRQGSAEYGDPAYRTGAHALATHSVLAYAQAFPQDAALARDVATAGLTWLAGQKATTGGRAGLYLGGNGAYVPDGGGGQTFQEGLDITWASTEHQIDTYFCLRLADRVLSVGGYAADAATLATNMWNKLWNASAGRLNQGLQIAGVDTADPLDVHSWGAIWLAATGRRTEALNTMSVEQLAPFKWTRTAPNGRTVTGYSTSYASDGYPNMTPHVWWEGTFSVGYAMAKLGLNDRWAQLFAEAAPGQFSDGSYPYVSDHDGIYELVPYRSVASTAWAVLAHLGVGIFDLGAI